MRSVSLSYRHRQAEIMDDPALDPGAHALALRALARINYLSNGAAALWKPIDAVARRLARPLRVLDVACGGGDVLLDLARRARKANRPLELSGCDISPVAMGMAKQAAHSSETQIQFFQWNAINDPLPQAYDVVTTTLFLHHLPHAEAVLLLRRLAALSAHLLLVNDLERSMLGWWAAWIGCRLLSRSPVVHFDGPVSVEGAFTCAEARQLAQQAGLTGAKVHRCWPCRYLLQWRRTQDFPHLGPQLV